MGRAVPTNLWAGAADKTRDVLAPTQGSGQPPGTRLSPSRHKALQTPWPGIPCTAGLLEWVCSVATGFCLLFSLCSGVARQFYWYRWHS